MRYPEVESSIIYEDNHIIVINKPAGILSQLDHSNEPSIIEHVKNYVKKKYDRPGNVYIHPVHRLDRVVSGCLILSRTTKATTRFNAMIRNDELEKKYLTVVSGRPQDKAAELTHFLIKDKSKNKVKIYNQAKPRAKKVQLSYSLLSTQRGHSLLEINLITGRSHQIRSQLSHINHPIIGDTRYQSKIKLKDRSILLHAYKLIFIHPVKKESMTLHCTPRMNKYWQPFESFIIEYK